MSYLFESQREVGRTLLTNQASDFLSPELTADFSGRESESTSVKSQFGVLPPSMEPHRNHFKKEVRLPNLLVDDSRCPSSCLWRAIANDLVTIGVCQSHCSPCHDSEPELEPCPLAKLTAYPRLHRPSLRSLDNQQIRILPLKERGVTFLWPSGGLRRVAKKATTRRTSFDRRGAVMQPRRAASISCRDQKTTLRLRQAIRSRCLGDPLNGFS